MSIADSRERAEVLTRLVRTGLDSAIDGRIERALRLFDEVLERFPPIAICYRPDEATLDNLIAAIAVTAALADRARTAAQAPQLKERFRRAVGLRLQMFRI